MSTLFGDPTCVDPDVFVVPHLASTATDCWLLFRSWPRGGRVAEQLFGTQMYLLSVRWRLPVDVAGAALADTAREMGVEVDALSQLVVGSLQQTTDPLTSSP